MTKDYIWYQPQQPHMPCTFRYPADWRVREVVENGYLEIFIAGPRNRAGTYSVSVTVSVTRPADQTPAEAAASFVSQFGASFVRHKSGPDSTIVAGMPAFAVEVAYSAPLPPNSVNPQWTVIRERSIFFQQGEQLYELSYAAPEDEYESWLRDFQILVESFTFPGAPDDKISARSTAAATSGRIREESSGYETEEDRTHGESE